MRKIGLLLAAMLVLTSVAMGTSPSRVGHLVSANGQDVVVLISTSMAAMPLDQYLVDNDKDAYLKELNEATDDGNVVALPVGTKVFSEDGPDLVHYITIRVAGDTHWSFVDPKEVKWD